MQSSGAIKLLPHNQQYVHHDNNNDSRTWYNFCTKRKRNVIWKTCKNLEMAFFRHFNHFSCQNLRACKFSTKRAIAKLKPPGCR